MTNKRDITLYNINDSANNFLCGALITNQSRVVLYTNSYFVDELKWKQSNLVGHSIDKLFTHSSKIFYESYLIPTLLHEQQCTEMQLTIFDGNKKRIPITVNARLDKNELIYWSFFNASKRDKLYEELLQTKEKLFKKTIELKTLATTDELTGLLNRREVKHRAVIALEQTLRSKQQICFMMMDIDYFKKVNDNWGHQEGDRVLKELGALLISSGRQTDAISRFGGEEFLLVIPNTNETEMLLFAKRLHQLIATITVNDIPVTVSIGFTLNDGSKSYDVLCHEADTALYQAKTNGRNRSEIFK
jgi:diguanylate cyclase (GGDEF)-like protein